MQRDTRIVIQLMDQSSGVLLANQPPIFTKGFTVKWQDEKVGLTANWKDLLLASHLILSVKNRTIVPVISTPSREILNAPAPVPALPAVQVSLLTNFSFVLLTVKFPISVVTIVLTEWRYVHLDH